MSIVVGQGDATLPAIESSNKQLLIQKEENEKNIHSQIWNPSTVRVKSDLDLR